MTVDINHAKELAEAGEFDKAWKIVNQCLQDNTNESRALLLLTYILEKSGRVPEAYHIAKRFCDIYPGEPAGWINVGRCCDILWKIDEAESAYKRAIACCREDELRKQAYNNMAALLIQAGRFKDAKPYAQRALDIEPENGKARHNLGMCYLAERNWAEGWKYYSASVGSVHRHAYRYGEEDEWDGKPDQVVVVHGEQGLGDEICAASVFQDAIDISKKVILDCDARLVGLYKRSFPKAKVYGTRTQKVLNWDEEDHKIDASIPAMELGKLFRLKNEDFPGTPYIIPDPERVTMWRALFDTKKKPVIGIAWSGGIPQTGSKFKQWSLDDLLPIFRSIDAHWVCLQYKDAQAEIDAFRKVHPEVDLKQYPHATLTKDYDDTAGIVAACDSVICMQTAVAHLAAAMGKHTMVFIPKNSQWRYAGDSSSMPWYKSMMVIHQNKRGRWDDVIEKFAEGFQDLRRAA